jgi:hypothetical protein
MTQYDLNELMLQNAHDDNVPDIFLSADCEMVHFYA